MIISGIVLVVMLVGMWKIYEKMGRQGWEAIIPIYNIYVLFDVLYKNGIKFLLLLVPIYNIYLVFKYNIDLAHSFGKSTGFGVGMTLLAPIFYCILGFGGDSFRGSAAA